MFAHVAKDVFRLFTLVCVASIPCVVSAQVVPAVKQAPKGDIAAKWDFFAGYSYIRPYGTVISQVGPNSPHTEPFSYVPVDGEVIGSVTRYFSRHWGGELVGDVHLQNDVPWPGHYVPANSFSGATGGVIYRFKNSSSTPFIHALVGGEIADGPYWQADNWGPVGTIGGGMDCETSLFKHHMAIRFIQADYQRVYENFGTGTSGGIGNINAYRLSAGAVFHTGTDDQYRPVLGSGVPGYPEPGFSRRAGDRDCDSQRSQPPAKRDLHLVGNRRERQRGDGHGGHRLPGVRHLYGERRGEGDQTDAGLPAGDSAPACRLHGHLYREAV